MWSLLAETWAPVCVPAVAILGHGFGDFIGATHLLLGYTTLGLILAGPSGFVKAISRDAASVRDELLLGSWTENLSSDYGE